MSTPSTSSPEEEPPRAIDIFQHLRLNLKNNSINCGCTILPDLYCIPCKTTVCKRCNYSFHKTHLVVSKRNAELNEEDINDKIQFNIYPYRIIDNNNISSNISSI